MNNNPLISQLKEISAFIKDKFHADKVILFGSYAYGKPDKDSDIDLLVIMETKKRFSDEGAKIRLKMEEKFIVDRPIDILVRTPSYIH